MADPKPPQNDKGKKARSFGPYALFLFVLAAIMIAYGGRDAWTHRVELSLDEYRFALYTFQVASQSVTPSEIEGKFKNRPKEIFFVKVKDLDDKQAQQYQELAAVGSFSEITPAQLSEAIGKGYLSVTDARHLTAYESHPVDPQNPGETAHSVPLQQDRYFVRAEAKSKTAWTGDGNPPAWLPEKTGQAWYEVKEVGDSGALIGALKGAGANIESLDFNITKEGGTSVKDPSSFWQSFLLLWGPWLLILVFFFLFLRQMRNQGSAGGVMSFGRSRAQLYTKENHTNVTFDDVAGSDEAKEEVKEIVEFLKNPGPLHAPGRAHPARRAARRRPRAAARRCSPRPSPARPTCRSSRSPARTSSRCSSASARAACATSSSRRTTTRPASSSWTRSTPSDGAAARASAAATTSASRRSTRSWSRWTASTPTRASSSSPPPTAPTCSTRRSCARAASTARS